ncbi:MAG TPA: GNAT family N-acetyltransferase [Thermoleophilaceae bacterium]|nr:GNAT family N-acetyltransferase [Thermoleophilaceae bacterium]
MVTRHVLADGTMVAIRPIAPEDKQELQDGLHRLSDETVQRRFLAPKARFTKAELRYLTEVDGHDHVALVAESERWPGMIVAVARYVRLDDDPDTAEAAIVVADALQGLGLGRLLAERLAAAATVHGVRRFTAEMYGDNRPAQRLMEVLTTRLGETDPDVAAAARPAA